MNYKCIQGFKAINARHYTYGEVITSAEYLSLHYTDRRFFMLEEEERPSSSDLANNELSMFNNFFMDTDSSNDSPSSDSGSAFNGFGGGDFGGGGAGSSWDSDSSDSGSSDSGSSD